jgi:hypothetical protein
MTHFFRQEDHLTAVARDYLQARGVDVDAALLADALNEMAPATSAHNQALKDEIARLTGILNTPAIEPFAGAVVAEAQHQVFRWGADHDETKDAFDWYWLLGYLAGKAARSAQTQDWEKALHHTVTAAAALANWHGRLIAARDTAREAAS